MSIKITQAAIEAGVKAYWLEGQSAGIIFERTTYEGTDKFIRDGVTRAFAKGVEAALREMSTATDCKSSPQTVQSPPATATHVAIDDAEKRVAKAITPQSDYIYEWKNYIEPARAAIRAMQGQRWGVWNIDANNFVPCWPSGPESSTDKELMEKACERQRRTVALGKYEVRPYDAEGAKTPEEIADQWVTELRYGQCRERVKEIQAKLADAIRAAKGGK